ncbi:MAG: SLC13 family permease [Anaerolineales bacterium]|nr:SLC13 family permease [Anaerolineales bacterium]
MTQINITFILLGLAIVLLMWSKLRPDVIALLMMLSLGMTNILTSQEVFSGFSRTAVIVMLSAFILAEGLRRSGITERIGLSIVRLFGRGERRFVFGVMSAGALLSLVMNNIAAASLLFPSVSGISRRSKVSASKLLMPLAFGTILGGMATLLTTTNIIVSGLLRNVDLPGFGLLDFAPIGIPLALIGIVFMVLWGRKSLPEKSPAERVEKDNGNGEELLGSYQLGDRLLRGRVRVGGLLNGKTLEESNLRENYHLNVIAIHRGKQAIPIEARTVLMGNDILLMMARPEDSVPEHLYQLLESLPSGEWEREYLSIPDMTLIETAVAPRSHLAGQTLRDIRFEHKFGAKVLAIWRHGRSIRTRLESQPLEFGDGLLLQGTSKSLGLLQTEPGLILLAESAPAGNMTLKGWLTFLIMSITLLLAVLFPSIIGEIMLSGAVCMVLIGALSMDQAYRAIEWRSIFLVAGMLPVGVAMEKTGAAAFLAEMVISFMGNAGHIGILTGLVILTVLLTQVINGAAAITVIAPIAIVIAQKVNMDPRSVAMAVAIASSMAFISPLGHAVNVMVMGAGGYTFRDYARVGIPLTIILVFVLLLILPLVMPMG